MAVIYSLVAALILALFLHWLGALRWLYRKYNQWRRLTAYKKNLKDFCSTLIVIGRRQGFNLKDVFINLGLAPSDLAGKIDKEKPHPPRCYVLVGGPGAGKSTIARKKVLDQLSVKTKPIPFFVSLREYDHEINIENFIAEKLTLQGFHNAIDFVKSKLLRPDTLCILDGLDEVRPEMQEAINQSINRFYHSFFSFDGPGQLIVTCRKEPYRSIPLDIPDIWEVVPLTDNQIQIFAENWPLGYPNGKNAETFWNDLEETPRILEVSRSPLILVGGLMLYTESTLGIPSERVKYLERIKDTLVEDWAVAQGHPPDPRRTGYSAVLAELALSMHWQQTSEMTRQDAVMFLREQLPNFGYHAQEADGFLQDLITKTGLMVQDNPGRVVFAQFRLQEYFASINLVRKVGPNGLAKLQPLNWWTESILFAVAQQADPTGCLASLFGVSPLIGAMAVAECPTPSIDVQRQAAILCLRSIDDSDESAAQPMISLLRKVSGPIEREVCEGLGKKLNENNPGIAALTGRILATAGTDAATATLSSHPESWGYCLETAGYLSSRFERLLGDWMITGSDAQSKRAIELLIDRPTIDLFSFVSRLPQMQKDRASYLASQILQNVAKEDGTRLRYPRGISDMPQSICACAISVQDPMKLLSRLPRRKTWFPENFLYGQIRVALVLCHDLKHRSLAMLSLNLERASRFSMEFGDYLLMFAAAIAGISLLVPEWLTASIGNGILILSLIFVLVGLIWPIVKIPWMRERYFYDRQVVRKVFPVGAGILFAAAIIGDVGTQASETIRSVAISGFMALILGMVGLHPERWLFDDRKSPGLETTVARGGAIAFLVYAVSSYFRLELPTILVSGIGVVIGAWAAVRAIQGFSSWLLVRGASQEADRFDENEVIGPKENAKSN